MLSFGMFVHYAIHNDEYESCLDIFCMKNEIKDYPCIFYVSCHYSMHKHGPSEFVLGNLQKKYFRKRMFISNVKQAKKTVL